MTAADVAVAASKSAAATMRNLFIMIFIFSCPLNTPKSRKSDACRILTIDLRHPTATLFPYAAALIPGIAQKSIPVSSS